MITVILSGGLGNQMFQYAAGRALALKLETELALDIYPLTKKKTKTTSREYELDIFNIQAIHTHSFVNKFFNNIRHIAIKYRDFFIKLGFYTDNGALFYSTDFEESQNGTTLLGHFQNEMYFKSVEKAIRKDFQFKYKLEEKNASVSEQIKNSNSVSIHIRRSDYVTTTNNFACCSIEYYQHAIQYIAKKVPDIHFYVFSDDMDWVKENMNFGNHPTTFIDWNTDTQSYRDMQLMSLCKHNIIANSSFSWWGAWLNENKDKIVITPKKWFKNDSDILKIPYFLPKGWIAL